MKKAITLITGILLAGAANAQTSVTLYGLVDAGFLFQNRNGGSGAIATTTHPLYLFNSGGDATSAIGLRGIEDLGGGYNVGFQLEGQFQIGSGALTVPGTLFNEYSNVFLGTPYGRMTVGKQIDPAYIALAQVDPRGLSNAFSAAGWWNFLQGNSANPSGTVYEQNAVSYSTKAGDFLFGALYGFGNTPGSISQGQTISTGLTYDNGHAILSAAYLQKNNATGARDLRTWMLGGGYRVGSLTVKGGYTDYRLPLGNNVAPIGNTPPSHVIVAHGGLNWSISPAQTMTIAYYFSEDRLNAENGTSTYVISEDYFLSKRTKIYGFAGLMKAKKETNGLTSLMTASLTTGYPGSYTTGIGIGIQHRF
ncbi:porin [Caballeronia novacaledonica]|uniref:Porin n=1 Tax=Caballeronia novacaledonica TaxID=1544861 RepID=A0ACB5R5U2_9BURK|nr:porin [Caballeronia sp. LZ029]MDR5748878.1 porin [Caballeronia sp. LZ029]GJH22546.1 porin [Caballeronia novacaledonica]